MRIVGINIPDNKKVGTALTYIYGIGPDSAIRILSGTKVDENKRVKDLNQEEIKKIQDFMEKNFKVEGELRQMIRSNVARLKDIQAYRGVRHMRKLPVRGQRTKTNSRTVRGNVRHTAGSGKRKVDLK